MLARARPSVAILGDGPAGATLATLLARQGVPTTVFAPEARPPLLVGESLVPAVIPILRRLGVEEEVAGFSELKPGASFTLTPDLRLHFSFGALRGRTPGYAYNVRRDRFDASLLAAAREAGARVVCGSGRLTRSAGSDRMELAAQSLEALGGKQPRWIVDATGRRRTIARLLALPTRRGLRSDEALFAHLRGVPLDREGHVHTDRLQSGWSWRIPLPGGRVSLGVVVRPELLRRFGSSAEEQFDGMLRSDPQLAPLTQGCERLTRVMRYDNYQSCSLRGVGPNWALVGDAFGFVDPVFSSGLFLAMESAERLARAIGIGTPRALASYERHVKRHIEVWHRLAGYYYDGRITTLFELGNEVAGSWPGRLVSPHIAKQMLRVLTGDAATRLYSRKLLDFMVVHALGERDPGEYAIR